MQKRMKVDKEQKRVTMRFIKFIRRHTKGEVKRNG